VRGKRILLGVSGGIAAYRACELARLLIHAGAEVQVVLTPRAAQFVTPLTFTALTGRPALVDEYPAAPAGETGEDDIYAHLNVTRGIDCFVIAPASADTLSKLAHGIADSLLTTAYLSNEAPVLIAPAMNVRMWGHAAVQENVAALKARGHAIIEPGAGILACGDVGAGRLAEPAEILAHIEKAISALNAVGVSYGSNGAGRDPLTGKRVIVTAGGTREYIDPVRFITNSSSGTLGLKVAAQLLERGALVELIDPGLDVDPALADRLSGRRTALTAFDLQSALMASFPAADALVMLAAVADYSPTQYLSEKRKKDGLPWKVELAETPDVLSSVTAVRRPGQLVAAVSLEDSRWMERAQAKANAKGADAVLAVHLADETPFGANPLNCALVSFDDVLAPPKVRTKDEAAALIVEWLAGGFGEAELDNEHADNATVQAVQP
jgi:phosphopantothenoylcysteine decarboxylase/phosphopantothenate--cysteine ligase